MPRADSARSPSRGPALLFAYGTLMRGYALHRVLAPASTFLGEGAVRGRLFDLGRYPGLVVGAGRVRGEIYRLDDPELLPVLDREEGYNFERRRAIVTLANGRRARAWVYRYRGPQNRAVPIPDGDYRRVHPLMNWRTSMAMTAAELVKADQEHLIHPLHHPIDNAEPMIYVKGRGSTIQEIGGHEYIDGLSGLWNVNVGHGRTELADAAAAQMKDLAYFSGYVGSSNIPAITLANKLIELAYDNMQAVFFTCGGAESNESAFKTARFYWKAQGKPDKVKIISRQQSYHGVTLQAMSATGMGAYWKMFEPRVPGFVHIQTCYPYRFQGAKPGESVGQAAARELEEAILREGPDTVAAFIGEPIHGGGGVIYPTDDYWPKVREICTRHKVLLIGDEVITGFCRTGRWFALGHWDVKPDILSFAKGVTSGYLPLGGIMVTKAIKDTMDSVKPEDRWMHAYTYSSHPTCCAVGVRNVEIMERERLWENAAKMGTRLHKGLQQAFGDHPNTGDIRGGKGLLAAVELVEDRATKKNFAGDKKVAQRIQAEMMKRGVVTRTRPTGGPHPAPGDSVYFAPPLVVTEDEVDRLIGVTRDAVKVVLGV